MTTQINAQSIYIQRPKCPMCNRKVNHLDIMCRCGGTFCMTHMLPESHDCQFDYKTYERKKMLQKIRETEEKQ